MWRTQILSNGDKARDADRYDFGKQLTVLNATDYFQSLARRDVQCGGPMQCLGAATLEGANVFTTVASRHQVIGVGGFGIIPISWLHVAGVRTSRFL